jgi:hypothetical protein
VSQRQPFLAILDGPHGASMRFGGGLTVPLDIDSAPLLLIRLAEWICHENVVIGTSAAMEASAKAFEALGNPGVSREIVTAVNEILAKHNPRNTA